jgi:hypothetical protein
VEIRHVDDIEPELEIGPIRQLENVGRSNIDGRVTLKLG